MLLVIFNPQIGPYQVLPLRDQSGPGSDGNKGYFRIPQSSSIAGTSPSNYLVSYTGHSFGGGGLTPLQRSSRVYSTAPADWATKIKGVPRYDTKLHLMTRPPV